MFYMKISVALAYYNGGTYIKEQTDSILPQLGEKDELIISVDDASDGSMPLLEQIAEEDSRVRLLKGPGKGVVKNFDYALRKCRGDIIFLSDHDDVWAADKVSRVMKAFEDPRVTAVLHDAQLMNQEGRFLKEPSVFSWRASRTGMVKNLIRNSYMGCCMAFRRELIKVVCPIPRAMYMHDFWIGMAAEQMGKVVLIEEPLLYYRRHQTNVTDLKHGNLGYMLEKRINMIRCLRLLKQRIREAGGPAADNREKES